MVLLLRVLYNRLPWPAWSVALAPDYTIFMPVNHRARSVYDDRSDADGGADGDGWRVRRPATPMLPIIDADGGADGDGRRVRRPATPMPPIIDADGGADGDGDGDTWRFRMPDTPVLPMLAATLMPEGRLRQAQWGLSGEDEDSAAGSSAASDGSGDGTSAYRYLREVVLRRRQHMGADAAYSRIQGDVVPGEQDSAHDVEMG